MLTTDGEWLALVPTKLMANHRLPKASRLRKRLEFECVFAARLSARDEWMEIRGAVNPLNHPRIGMAVSRRIGGAVARNRWKRLLREAFRLTQHHLPAFDFVCLPRAARPPELHQLVISLPELASRIGRQAARRQLAEGDPPGTPIRHGTNDTRT